ncbi:trypsin-like peptidase domain-containing protein [Cerasicoccus fimbriatus]|uniref:trypsin-like peptidase domain-containing protein n=1 Tax=Cerasicoccus fimbriatus TaxID=3014554 RepID=UPI0022B409CD|nr:trypsin-like peptidase domain-containing protein [Cerasicoccus sp. TK19100]
MKRSHQLTLAFTITAASAIVAGFAANQLVAESDLPPAKLERDTAPLERNGPRIVSFADVLDDVTPAVVSVHTSHFAELSRQEKMLRRYYGMEDNPTVSGVGSGFIVTPDGYVLTNNHVVAGGRSNVKADEIIVQLDDGREFEAVVVGADPQSDVAVLKLNTADGEALPYLRLGDSSQLRVGDIVFAAGNPLSIGLTVTQGIVSALDRTDLGIYASRNGPGYENFIQTDAAINRGNSGGPLVDAEGRVVGINSAIASTSGGSIGIGFAIPINFASQIMDSLVNDGEVRRGFIGVQLDSLDRQLAQAFGLSSSRGALVVRVTPGLPGEQAGMRHGDVVTAVNGQGVDSVQELIYLISSQAPGTDVALTIFRNQQYLDLDVTLGDRDALLSGPTRPAPKPEPMEIVEPDTLIKGVSVTPITPRDRREHEIPGNVDGLLISGVTDKYAELLSPGMVIESINGQEVANFDEALAALSPDGVNRLYVFHEGGYRYVPLIAPKSKS